VYCQMYGARPVTVEYEASDRGPNLPASRVIETIRAASPRVVCLPNPDSPTGSVFAPDVLRAIIEAAASVGAVILIDEAYYPFYKGTALPWVAEYPHLVVARTFSKAWGMAGVRAGFTGSCQELATLMHRVRPMYEIGSLAASMTEAMLEHEDAVLASVHRLNAGKRAFLDAMEVLGLRVLRNEGNFLHVAFGSHAAGVHAALAPVVLYRRDFKDPCLKGFSRFSSTTATLFAPVIERIRGAVAGGAR
jgi:histidinol-phosphate aminotransferase